MEEAISNYQVFINHRGPDTKNTLVSVLYCSLCRYGLRVFMDQEELSEGNCVYPNIKAVIDSASIHIAIFSPRYAESQWCLEELCWMLQQSRHGSTTIPIFCDVKPSDLRHVNKGQYAYAFEKHRERGSTEVERWQKALKEVAEFEGHEFRMGEDDWGDFVHKIVDIVQEKVRREPLVVAEHPVGLNKAAENLYNEILMQMDPSDNITIVAIVGLAGCGKTTLATHLYNLVHSQFRRYSFLYEVSRSTSALTSSHEKLLFDLLGCSQLHIGSPQEGKSLLRQRLRGLSRVLIVLDNIDNLEQIDCLLLPVKDVLVDGSLIVITSRDKGLLSCCQVNFLYDMKLLDEKDARELFCYHAFLRSEAPTGFEDLVREIVSMCGGYPLALKFLGAHLIRKQLRYWKLQLKNLQKKQFPNEIVQKIVRASYDSLEKEAKMVFLALASFFEGLDVDLVLWCQAEMECPLLDCIKILDQKCLVDVHDAENEDLKMDHRLRKRNKYEMSSYRDCKIVMHKIVKDIAKAIASEEFSICSEDKMISVDSHILDQLRECLKGTPAEGSSKLRVVLDGIEDLSCLSGPLAQVEYLDMPETCEDKTRG